MRKRKWRNHQRKRTEGKNLKILVKTREALDKKGSGMSLGKNDVMNTLYNAGLITLGAVATSMVTRKLMKDGLGVPGSTQGILKLVVAVGGGSVLVRYLQKMNYVPEEPFKDQ